MPATVGTRWGVAQREPEGTLTGGGAHTSCPELAQDEALLALSQGQQEFIGFYALLTAREGQPGISDGREW